VTDVRDLKVLPEPFATADLPDAVVNQRLQVSVIVGNHANRLGRAGLAVWMDDETTSDAVGGNIGEWPQASYRGHSLTGFHLTEEERRYVAASLYSAALNLVEHRNEP
jgi:hypothetical protein